jgi:hypothetical protein
MGWRQHSFVEGESYRVIADCDVSLERVYQFRNGEVVVFGRDYYSHYDGLSVYSFRSQTGEERFWALHDDEPGDKWRTYFERVDETPAD